MAQQLEAILLRHDHVHQDQVRHETCRQIFEFFRVLRCFDLVTQFVSDLFECRENGLQIVDRQQPGPAYEHGISAFVPQRTRRAASGLASAAMRAGLTQHGTRRGARRSPNSSSRLNSLCHYRTQMTNCWMCSCSKCSCSKCLCLRC